MSLVEFSGLELATSPGRVMIPRATSIPLVERALRHIGRGPATVVDVGTGSGAIAIAVAEAAPRTVVWATDVSEDAVALARQNAERCGVAERVRVRHGHLLEPVPGQVDVIVANLPYLAWRERSLHPELTAEPEGAVFAMGDGLGPYRCLLTAAASRLSPEGLIAVQMRGSILAARGGELEELTEALLERAA
jgi:release factor glutamine methyltransferase